MKNRYMRIISAFCFVLIASSLSFARESHWEENPSIDDILKKSQINATFVLYDAQANTYFGHNKTRAKTRFIPASTYKIPHSLIGLTLGVVKNVDEPLPYKGDPHPFIQAWAQDMGLRQAIALSNVPIYQELARRIGINRMREQIVKMHYGNRQIGTSVEHFWLKGPLTISAMEQAHFLAELAQGTLPYPQNIQKSVREICLLEQGAHWKLYGKTGWQNAPNTGVGWWVGWVEKQGRIYAFAFNMDMHNASQANQRVDIAKACLQALGIIDETVTSKNR